ncbi:F-box only protein 30-like isoform X1 [Panonychus citri]|uniref:F-box only protein 30-like isoform X1 n=1 Tax=Panonychus citri TaxID=50023 RepID=UPI002307B4B8|nr:F-box only protein 30-like isoform X1 [Panonychus citri]
MTQAAYIVSESTDCETIKCGLETEISMKQDLEDHSHCDNCIKITKCRYKNTRDAACPIVYCIEGCGFKFHRCKSDEHKLLCANEKILCINHSFGCPTFLPRKDLTKHISCCPASVIHCYIEWNRWPIYTRDRKLTQPLVTYSLSNQHLDVALTLRDQRMLEELWTATRKTRCTLRNSLTRKYPAVPLKPYCGAHIHEPKENGVPTGSSSASSLITPQTVSDDDSDSSPWQMTKSPPGLQSSVCARLNGRSFSHLNHNNNNHHHHHHENNSQHNHFNHNHHHHDNHLLQTHNSHHHLNNNPVINSNHHNHHNLSGNQENSPVDSLSDRLAFISAKDKLTDCDKKLRPSAEDKLSTNGFIPKPPILPNNTSLSLDLNLNSIAQFQAKPKLMYTFKCAQEFRRDEYGSHYKNFHGDILGSINGWMEHRCPLWQYGCNFVQRRIHPFPEGTRITFNPIVESFGHVMSPNCDKIDESSDISLLNLPYEILRQICFSLDGFSLNNLSMTCSRMREICSTLLEKRGVVILQWERRVSTTDSTLRWVVGSKKWAFSTNFTEIKNWYFDSKHDVLNHIKHCPHYEIIKRTEPIALPAMKNEDVTKKQSS